MIRSTGEAAKWLSRGSSWNSQWLRAFEGDKVWEISCTDHLPKKWRRKNGHLDPPSREEVLGTSHCGDSVLDYASSKIVRAGSARGAGSRQLDRKKIHISAPSDAQCRRCHA